MLDHGTGCGVSPLDRPDHEEQEVPSGLWGQSMSPGNGCGVIPPYALAYGEQEVPSGMWAQSTIPGSGLAGKPALLF